MQTSVVAILFCLAATLQTSYALKCIKCNSKDNPKCGDPFDGSETDKMAQECTPSIVNDALDYVDKWLGSDKKLKPDAKFTCSKYVMNGAIYRDCGVGIENKFCEALKDAKKDLLKEEEKDKFSCLSCDSDLCNTGTSFQAAAGLIFSSFAVILSRYF